VTAQPEIVIVDGDAPETTLPDPDPSLLKAESEKQEPLGSDRSPS